MRRRTSGSKVARRLITLLGVAGLGAAAGADPPPILHEYVPLGPLVCNGGTCRRGGAKPGGESGDVDTSNPDAIEGTEGRLEQPVGPAAPLAGEQVYKPQPGRPVEAGGSPPFGGDPPPERRDRVFPDRSTDGEPPGKHVYHEVFNPAVFPFKRMTALDAVDANETLYVAERRLTLRPPAGAETRDPLRDAFWGSVVVDLEPGRWVPIPSASAEPRILSYQAQPPADLEFAVDGADNVFVRGRVAGRHRLTWLSDAPQRYFAQPIPPVLLSDEPRVLLHPLPPLLAKRAAQVLARIGVDPRRKRQELAAVLGPLVEWFRSFESGQLPTTTESNYLDLALARKGCCRHRSFAFTITAIAAGIPARYVENELHVFVEVYLPGAGWMRINLGGTLIDEQVDNMEGKVPYQPKGADTLPEPEPFARGAEEAARQHMAVVADAARHGEKPTDSSPKAGSTAKAGAHRPDEAGAASHPPGATAGRPGAPGTEPGGTPPAGGSSTGGGTSGAPAAAGDAPSAAPSPPQPPRARTTLSLQSDAREAFRGDAIQLRGHLEAERASPAGLRVSIELLAPDGSTVPLGDVTTATDGSFTAGIEVPRTLPLGRYRLIAHTAGDATRAPARSTP